MIPSSRARFLRWLPTVAPASRLGWLFLAGSLLLGGWAVAQLVGERLRWRDSSVVRFRTGDATGIWPGVNVTLSGYRIGRVETVTLADDAKVDVRLRVAAPYRALIGPRSRATAAREGLIGDTVVILTPDVGPKGASRPTADLKVPFQQAASPADLMKELTATRLRLDHTLQGIATVVQKDLPKAIGSFDGTLRDIRSLTGTVQQETGRTAAETRATLRTYQETGRQLTSTSQQLGAVGDQIRATGAQVGTASEEATAVLRTAAPVFVDSLREIGELSGTINHLIKALGGSLLLGGPQEKPPSPPSPPAPPPVAQPPAPSPVGPPRLPHRGGPDR
ncbi:MAG: MlaD family protein [Synechococcaceae cyanobacterium]|nr:MlaD family protein [Synechococcaceae cyanobacterium]